MKEQVFLIGNLTNENTQEVVVINGRVRTTNQKIRELIKDYLNDKYVHQFSYFASVDSSNNYIIKDYR